MGAAKRSAGRHSTVRSASFFIAATSKGICRLTFDDSEASLQAAVPQREHRQGRGRASRVRRRNAGGDRDDRSPPHDLPIDVAGTAFQEAVWRELRKIPAGETRSYAEIAAAIGQPKAVRAVGTANGDNHVSVLIPCHRVIRSDGSLGGYGGGIERKKKLLAAEGHWSGSRSCRSPNKPLAAPPRFGSTTRRTGRAWTWHPAEVAPSRQAAVAEDRRFSAGRDGYCHMPVHPRASIAARDRQFLIPPIAGFSFEMKFYVLVAVPLLILLYDFVIAGWASIRATISAIRNGLAASPLGLGWGARHFLHSGGHCRGARRLPCTAMAILNGLLAALIAPTIFAAVTKELMFRGILFRWLEELGGSWVAVAAYLGFLRRDASRNPNATWIGASGLRSKPA